MTAVHAPGLPRSRHTGLSRTSVRIAHTDPGDTEVEITVEMPLMACSAFLGPAQARALAADLLARADLIGPPPYTTTTAAPTAETGA